MRDTSFDVVVRRSVGQRGAPSTDRADIEAAWLVLEAAIDLGDDVAVTACRRIIDASLNGRMAAAPDVDLVVDYFR